MRSAKVVDGGPLGWVLSLCLAACSGQGNTGDALDAATDASTGDAGASAPDGQGPVRFDAGDGMPGPADPEGRVEVEGELIDCPSVVVLVAPAVLRVGEAAYLSATATPPSKALKYLWRVSEGKVEDPSASMTSYHCTSPGEKSIEIFVWEGPCSDTALTGITCE